MGGEGPFRAEEPGRGPGRGPGRLEKNAPRAGRTEPPISWACRPPGRRELLREAREGGGRPPRRRTSGPGAEEIEAAQSLPAFRSTSPASSRGDPERLERAAARPPPLSSGSLGTWASSSGRPPTGPHSYHPQPTPSPGPLFQPRSPARAAFYPSAWAFWTPPSRISPS